jgi:hypothetical protein
VIGVARDSVADLLTVRLLALRLKGRSDGIASALELVTDMLGGGLLRVRLDGRGGLVYERG